MYSTRFQWGQLAGIQAHCSPPESTEGLWFAVVADADHCRSMPFPLPGILLAEAVQRLVMAE
jgi:hypothetical protein